MSSRWNATPDDGKPRRGCNGAAGFTLIEVVLAITIFALMGGVLYGAFSLGHTAVEKSAASFNRNQKTRSIGDLLATYIRSAYPYRKSIQEQAIFFDGGHAALTCAQCHTSTMQPTRTGSAVPLLRIGFTTTPTACVSCHKDVHLGQLKQACETCHPVETPKFRVTEFAHAATRYPLTGKHAPLQCEACHKVETGAFPAGHGTARRLTGMDTACASCHQDPHRGQLGRECETCHGTDTFDARRYTHKNARSLRAFFTGRHASATCAACHKPLAGNPAESKAVANYQVSTRCTTCHTDVHKGALGSACETCHKP